VSFGLAVLAGRQPACILRTQNPSKFWAKARDTPSIQPLAAMFMAIGLVLPLLTGQIQQFGNMLLPMHIPVLLCGLICGWQYGLGIGFILPPLRYLIFGMPVLFPLGIAMAFELATYGFAIGLLYSRSKWKCVFSLYCSMVVAMFAGRIVWGVARVLMTGVAGEAFTWQLFMAGAFLNAIPGIMLQLVLIPAVMIALNKAKLVQFTQNPQTAKTAIES